MKTSPPAMPKIPERMGGEESSRYDQHADLHPSLSFRAQLPPGGGSQMA